MKIQDINIIKDGAYYKIMCPCETCGKSRYLRCNSKTKKVTTYRADCNKCSLNKNRATRKNKIIDEFKKIDVPEKAYIFGFLWADGFLKKGITGGNSIQLCIHAQDEAVIDFFIKHVGGKKFNRDYIDKKTNKIVLRRTWELNSNKVYENFISLNFRKNLMSIPHEYISHFMRGLIDGDGCYSIKQNKNWIDSIFITSDYNQDWSFLLNIKEIKNHIIKRLIKSNGRVSLFYISGKKQDKIDFLKWIYQDSTFHLERKYNKINRFL